MLRALWRIDVYLISTLVNKSLYYLLLLLSRASRHPYFFFIVRYCSVRAVVCCCFVRSFLDLSNGDSGLNPRTYKALSQPYFSMLLVYVIN